jgi:hypothetical protein
MLDSCKEFRKAFRRTGFLSRFSFGYRLGRGKGIGSLFTFASAEHAGAASPQA